MFFCAQSKEEQKSIIAFIDMKHVASTCKAGKSIDDQLCKINDQSKTEYIALENNIKDFEKKNSNLNNQNSADNVARTLEDMQIMLYDAIRKKKYQIEEAYQEALAKLEQTIKTVVAEIAIEKGLKIVILKDVIVYQTDDILDITDETIKKVDNICQTIDVDLQNLNSSGNSAA